METFETVGDVFRLYHDIDGAIQAHGAEGDFFTTYDTLQRAIALEIEQIVPEGERNIFCQEPIPNAVLAQVNQLNAMYLNALTAIYR